MQALPDTPSRGGLEAYAEPPWANNSLSPSDRENIAWAVLTPLCKEQVSYTLLWYLFLEVNQTPNFGRGRIGPMAVFSASYRRLQVGQDARTQR